MPPVFSSGDTVTTVYTLGAYSFSSFFLWLFLFLSGPTAEPTRIFCFPEHGAVAGLLLFLALCAQLLQTVKEICCL